MTLVGPWLFTNTSCSSCLHKIGSSACSFKHSGRPERWFALYKRKNNNILKTKSKQILSVISVAVWDQSKCCRFKWLWYDATTFAPYTEETSYENSLLVQQTGGLALSSLMHVMKSLTPNAKGIFLLLARYQMENKDNANYQGTNHLSSSC